jgi:hypothetical protein
LADLEKSFSLNEQRLHRKVIPATPTRGFDESAIGSQCCIYPLHLYDATHQFARQTVAGLADEFVDERGFFHPFVHSGYNPYLTLQIAHSLLLLGDKKGAWKIAHTILRQAHAPYSFPEAMHPFSGGGVMGDGHHGWVAAEIVLFLRAALVREEGTSLVLFDDDGNGAVRKGKDIRLAGVPTSFGHFSVSLRYEGERLAVLELDSSWWNNESPSLLEIHLPFDAARVSVIPDSAAMEASAEGNGTLVRCSSRVDRLLFTMRNTSSGDEKESALF